MAEARVRRLLRTATAQAHARLDALAGAMPLETAEGYALFLRAHALSLPALEACVWSGLAGLGFAPAAWLRSAALAADFAALGLAQPAPLPAPAIVGEAALFGAAYVLEGSRLGAVVLLAGALRGPSGGAAHQFLAHQGPPRAWALFLQRLEASAAAAEPEAAVHGAQCAFAHYTLGFERAAGLRTD